MRFYTRELHKAIQKAATVDCGVEFESRLSEANQLATRAESEYRDYLHAHDSDFSASTRELAWNCLHDSRIVQATIAAPTSIELVLDLSTVPFSTRKQVSFRFIGITYECGISELEGQIILEHELLVYEREEYQLNVLCHRVEFSLRFKQLETHDID